VFRSHAWLHTWWRHFGRSLGGEAELFLLEARDQAGQLRALLPLYCQHAFRLRRLRFLGAGAVGSDYLGVIAAPADEARAAHLFASALADELRRGALDLIDLDSVDAAGALARALPACLGQAVALRERWRWGCPFTAPPPDFDAYLQERPQGAGAQYRRRLRWLRRRPGFVLERLTTPAEIDEGFDDLLALHRERWAAEGGGDGIATPALAAFHRDAAGALAAEGVARLYFLRAEGARRAALYGFVDAPARTFLFYQSGHQCAWRPRSVGTVLLGLALEECAHDGLSFDFGHGREPYKQIWGTDERTTAFLRLVSQRGRGRLVDAGERVLRQSWRFLRRRFR
jgi:CelD/BcsL family acetyltransferase involved in cellulose biosynthesis